MKEPPVPSNEPERLAALQGLGVLDTPPEERFDRITRLAQEVFSVPIALVTFIDANRQWFKSCQGLGISETPRGISFCGYAILSQEVFVIEDATHDERFADNPLVLGPPYIHFYAGSPLRLNDGHVAGTLCILSSTPRAFNAHDRTVLTELGGLVIAELEDVYTATRERELREFIESAGAIIQSVDETGVLRMVNRAWTAALGYSSQEVVGKSVFDFIDPSEHDHCSGFFSHLSNNNSTKDIEATFLAKDGHKVQLAGMVDALQRSDGTISSMGIFHDITARRELERMRSQVAHHVSHELKTPLTAMGMTLQLFVETGNIVSPDQRKFLDVMRGCTTHLTRMVEDLLETSRSDSGKLKVNPKPGNFGEVLLTVVRELLPLADRAGITLSVQPPMPAGLVLFDPIRLRQILSNLIGNALKFTPRGGHITVGTNKRTAGFIEVYVRDNGVGIKTDDLERLFDRLYQTSNKVLQGESGLGLGLHICRELVEAHGGSIWVESDPGNETTFHFTLPKV